MSGRDDLDFHSRWAVSVDDMMHHLNELQPTVIHSVATAAEAASSICKAASTTVVISTRLLAPAPASSSRAR